MPLVELTATFVLVESAVLSGDDMFPTSTGVSRPSLVTLLTASLAAVVAVISSCHLPLPLRMTSLAFLASATEAALSLSVVVRLAAVAIIASLFVIRHILTIVFGLCVVCLWL